MIIDDTTVTTDHRLNDKYRQTVAMELK